jgi:hypothetical protein
MRALILSSAAVSALAACAPPAHGPPPAVESVYEAARRQIDYRATTVPDGSQQRFLIEFTSLTDRELCFNADRWPTAEGLRGVSRTPRVEGEMLRLAPHGELNGFVRFDQLNPAALEGDGARYIDFDPEPVFCESGAAQ